MAEGYGLLVFFLKKGYLCKKFFFENFIHHPSASRIIILMYTPMEKNSLLYHFFLDPLAHGVACLLLAYLLAPTQFVKVVYQETHRPYSVIVKQYLSEKNFKIFFSGAPMYALRQFIAAFAFGISQWIYLFSLKYCTVSHSMGLVVWQSVLVGIVETVITIYTETKEIAANKGGLMKRKGKMADIITPIFLRNVIAGSSPILAREATKGMESLFMNSLVCTLFSILISALSIPFDLVATQNCGSEVPMTWMGRLRHIVVVEKEWGALFNGLGMRIVQIVPYSVAHSLIILCLN